MNILITGIGGPTPRSIASTIRRSRPDFRLIGMDANPKAIGFFMPGLVDAAYLAPRVDAPGYWDFIHALLKKEKIDMAFVQPESEVVGWGDYFNANGKFPCPVFIPPKALAVSLMDKAIMADLLKGTNYIPKTIKVTQDNPRVDEVADQIGFPCWIRATKGSGGLGSLKINDAANYKSWLFINNDIKEFTVSEFLTGRHLANQMLYYQGEYIKGASLECVEYVMANVAPSKVTGNTSFGRFINIDKMLEFCDECTQYLCNKLGIEPHGVLSYDIKEDAKGNFKVTEVNIRHMAYTGVMAQVGFDLVTDTITLLTDGHARNIHRQPFFHYNKTYVFLRDVDTEPVLLDGEHCFCL